MKHKHKSMFTELNVNLSFIDKATPTARRSHTRTDGKPSATVTLSSEISDEDLKHNHYY